MKDTLPDRVRIGVFEVDLRAGELRHGQRTICLQEQGLFVLRLLVEQAGEIVTREELKQKLWPNDTVVDFDHGINTVIRRLRVALGDSADEPKYIETVARRGYRLLLPVERISSPADEASSSSDGGVLVAAGGAADRRARTETASLIGKRVSHYRVLSVIGGGGMGLVYEAEDLKLGRRVALKFLPEELADNAVALQRFEREAKTASSLNHPNICTIYEVEEHENQPFIVMELLEGETLRDRLASVASSGRTLALDKLLDIAIPICEGLQAAHSKGIIHRDIKPANVFLTAPGQVKILDFGLAKLMEAGEDEQATAAAAGAGPGDVLRVIPNAKMTYEPEQSSDASLTRTGLAMGTAGYMSPEQVRGEKLDARTDVFSFGLVLYEMATGQRAFTTETASVVQDAILNQAPVPVRGRNPSISPKLENIINRAIEKDRERRYQSAADMGTDLQALADEPTEAAGRFGAAASRWKWIAAAIMLCLVIGGAGWYWRSHRAPKLANQDSIVIADFANSTGDAVFDDSLKQALTIQLEQSPFLNVLPSRKVAETLKLMNRSEAERLTENLTREICVRTGSKAMILGSIALLAHEYVIGLQAVDCNLGQSLGQTQQRSPNKEDVLKALDKGASDLRAKLGESLSSVEKYATPLEAATTPSLEALKAYSLGWKVRYTGERAFLLPLFQRAVELDPNFAMAYAARSTVSGAQGALDARKAYELRGRVSERERFYIEGEYYWRTTGELEKAVQVYEDWLRLYPQDPVPYVNLGDLYASLGDFESSISKSKDGIRRGLNYWILYLNLASSYEDLNRLDEALVTFNEGEKLHPDAEGLFQGRYVLAFLSGDREQMSQLAAAAIGRPDVKHTLFAIEADTEAWYGRLRSARTLTQRAMQSASADESPGLAALDSATAALREVEFGEFNQARVDAVRALGLGPSPNVRAMSALALARAGEKQATGKVASALDNDFPLATLVQRYWLPTIRAALAIRRNDPNKALHDLNAMGRIELSGADGEVNVFLCPAYVRGEAYLMLHDGNAAVTEFQKFIDHYGHVGNFSWGALARLGLARAYALEAQTDPAARDKARTAYQNFLTLWKDADPDVPIYKQAKAEYAKLQ